MNDDPKLRRTKIRLTWFDIFVYLLLAAFFGWIIAQIFVGA